MLARGRLLLDTPALHGHLWRDLQRSQDIVRALMAERTGRDPEDFELRVIATVLVAAMTAAMTEWTRQDGRVDIMKLLDPAMDLFERGARLDAP
jgi:hypothetical protein